MDAEMKPLDILSPIIKAASYLPINPDDYHENGILFCGKCHTPKQAEIMPGVIVRCLCECEGRERIKRENESANKLWHQMSREWVSGYENMKINDGDNTAMKIARKVVENWRDMKGNGIGFALYGGTGTGKTYAAAAVANAVIDMGGRAWIATASKMVDMFSVEKEVVESRLKYFDLVVIDDLGAQRETEYADQRIFDILDTRFNSSLPTIITTNMDLSKPTNDRIYSRIIGACSGIFRISGEDMRKKEGAEKRKLMEAIFNAE